MRKSTQQRAAESSECERMSVEEVVNLTGISKDALFKHMQCGSLDLGVVLPGKCPTYVFFRPKVERLVYGEPLEDADREILNLLTRIVKELEDR